MIPGDGRDLAFVAGVALVAAAVVLFPRADGVIRYIPGLPTGVRGVAGDVTVLGDPVVVLVGGLGAYALGQWTSVLSSSAGRYIAAAALLAVVVAGAAKHGFTMPRPAIAGVDGYGFPSGHVLGAAALAAAVVLYAPRPAVGQRMVVLAAAVFVVVVAASRVLTGAHYVEDVLAGAGLGVLVALVADNAVSAAMEVLPW